MSSERCTGRDRAEAQAAQRLGRTTHISRFQGGWFSHGLFPRDADILIHRPGGGELACTEGHLAKSYRALDLLPTSLCSQPRLRTVQVRTLHETAQPPLKPQNPRMFHDEKDPSRLSHTYGWYWTKNLRSKEGQRLGQNQGESQKVVPGQNPSPPGSRPGLFPPLWRV